MIVLIVGRFFSINFPADASLDAAPLNPLHDFPVVPPHDAAPVTVTIEYVIANDRRDEFSRLMEEVQVICRRNGAFDCRRDESLKHPDKFRLEYVVSTCAEHLRQNLRMTVDETQVLNAAWDLHSGDSEPYVRHYLVTQRAIHLPGYGLCGRTFADTTSLSRPKLAVARSSPDA